MLWWLDYQFPCELLLWLRKCTLIFHTVFFSLAWNLNSEFHRNRVCFACSTYWEKIPFLWCLRCDVKNTGCCLVSWLRVMSQWMLSHSCGIQKVLYKLFFFFFSCIRHELPSWAVSSSFFSLGYWRKIFHGFHGLGWQGFSGGGERERRNSFFLFINSEIWDKIFIQAFGKIPNNFSVIWVSHTACIYSVVSWDVLLWEKVVVF